MILSAPHFAKAAVFLDGASSGCANGRATYNPSTRTCGSGLDTVYMDLTAFSSGIVAGQTNYIRSGSYFRDDLSGSLYIAPAKAGSAGNRTIIKAYPGEERQAIIGTATRGATYNSNPNDATGVGSWNYYPNTALTIQAPYVTIDGVKTYGEVSTNGASYVQLMNSDFGGGGPATSGQGAVIKLEHTADALVQNDKIHNSSLAVDSQNNGPGIIFYDANAAIIGNTFFDNYSSDIFTKDSGVEAMGKTIEIANNFFMSSALPGSTNKGIAGNIQDLQIASQHIHNNIFLNKVQAYGVGSVPLISDLYNNTFINSGYDIANDAGGGAHPIASYNNVFYHQANQYFAQLYMDTGTTYTDYLAASNWNMYYQNGSKWGKSAPGALNWETTLPGWQTRTGLDQSSLVGDPNFVNASGAAPADFKRLSYGENFTGSAYGTKAGAYITGNEQIGVNWSVVTDTIAPATPSGLTVQ